MNNIAPNSKRFHDVDLHIHSNNSDGKFTVEQIIDYVAAHGLAYISITDHDTIRNQDRAIEYSTEKNITYYPGIELNVVYSHPDLNGGKDISLDLLGYNIDVKNGSFVNTIKKIAYYRVERFWKIIENLNAELERMRFQNTHNHNTNKQSQEQAALNENARNLQPISREEGEEILQSVDGTVGRVHIAKYLVKNHYATNIKDAFTRFLVKCDVPKYRVTLKEGISLIHKAGGIALLAHPMDPLGTSLVKVSGSLQDQLMIISDYLLEEGLDGWECFHSRLTEEQRMALYRLAKKKDVLISAGSDCHQNPILIGSIGLPEKIRRDLFIFKL